MRDLLAALLTLTVEAALLLTVMVCIDPRGFASKFRFAGIFFAIFFIDNLLITAASLYPGLRLIPDHIWEGFLVANWSGKLYSILATSLIIALCRSWLSLHEIGLVFRQQSGSLLPAGAVTALLGAGFLLSGLPFERGPWDWQLLAFMAVIPGVNEELVYRGVMLASVNRIFPPRWNLLGAQMGIGAVLVTLVFALLHGFWIDGSFQVHFLAARVGLSLFTGFTFAWLRERTGSLVFPILAHGAVDFCSYFGRMV